MVESSLVRFPAADGTQLGLHVLGSGPPVVCIPGGPGRASVYLEDLAGLSETHTLLRLDLRGTGMSELPTERASLSFPRLADDIEDLRVLRDLATMDLLGHSAGCFVSLVYASRHPERISRLVLLTPSAVGLGVAADDIAQIRAARSDEEWYAEAMAVAEERAMGPAHRRDRPDPRMRMFGYGAWDERAQAHAAATDTQMSLRATAAFGSEVFAEHVETFLVDLQALTAPVLIVVGSRDGITGAEAGQHIANLLPNATVATIPHSGHYPWVDAPEDLHHILTDFLA